MVADALLAAGVATLHEAAGRRGLCRGLRLVSGGPFAGPATTVRLPAGDNLGIHAALAHARPGSVLCVAGGSGGTYGAVGELIALAARVAGLAAIVLDEAARDVVLLGSPPSVVARTVSAEGTFKRRFADLDGPVALAGVLIEPGDWVVGDADGVLVVPSGRLDPVLAGAATRTGKEESIRAHLATGATTAEVLGLATLIEGGHRP